MYVCWQEIRSLCVAYTIIMEYDRCLRKRLKNSYVWDPTKTSSNKNTETCFLNRQMKFWYLLFLNSINYDGKQFISPKIYFDDFKTPIM